MACSRWAVPSQGRTPAQPPLTRDAPATWGEDMNDPEVTMSDVPPNGNLIAYDKANEGTCRCQAPPKIFHLRFPTRFRGCLAPSVVFRYVRGRSGHPVSRVGSRKSCGRSRTQRKRPCPPLANCLCFRDGGGLSPQASLRFRCSASRKGNNRLAALRRGSRHDMAVAAPDTMTGKNTR